MQLRTFSCEFINWASIDQLDFQWSMKYPRSSSKEYHSCKENNASNTKPVLSSQTTILFSRAMSINSAVNSMIVEETGLEIGEQI